MSDNKRPLILVSNDDGHTFEGLKALTRVAREFADVVVAAPMVHQSGKGSAITFMSPLRAFKASQEPGLTTWVVDGTPADCVKLGLSELTEGRQPDLVLSGINHGYNTGVATLNSGTVGGAIEAAVHDIPAVAFSLGQYGVEADMTPCLPMVRRIIKHVLEHGLPRKVCLNVNFPYGKGEFKGVKMATLGMGRWCNETERRTDPFGLDYYWLTGHYKLDDPNDTTNDVYLINQGYITVTPIKVDNTAHELLNDMGRELGFDTPANEHSSN